MSTRTRWLPSCVSERCALPGMSGVVRLAWHVLIILGFFLVFSGRMADREFLIAVLIYFMCPTGFGMAPLLQPLYKSDRDSGFTSAFMSLYIIVTLIVYTLVVLFLA